MVGIELALARVHSWVGVTRGYLTSLGVVLEEQSRGRRVNRRLIAVSAVEFTICSEVGLSCLVGVVIDQIVAENRLRLKTLPLLRLRSQ